MKLLRILFVAIAYTVNFCAAKPTKDPGDELLPVTICRAAKIMSSVKSKLGQPECGSSEDLLVDIRTVLGEILGFTLPISITGIASVVEGIRDFFRGFDQSNKDIIHKFACGLNHFIIDPDYVKVKRVPHYMQVFMAAADIDTPNMDLQGSNMLDNCPDESKSQLDALLSALRRSLKFVLRDLGYVISIPAGAIGGAVQGGNGVLTGLSNGCHNGNVVDSALGAIDSGVKGCGRGFADGSIKGFSSLEGIDFR